MKSYLALSSKYLSANLRKTRLAVLSVLISVALVTGVFSMLDVFLRFEKIQVIHDYGNYHLAIKDPTEEEMRAIGSRIDVKNTGRWKDLGTAVINSLTCKLGALDEKFAGNMNIAVIEGRYPAGESEVMLERWAAESPQLKVKTGHTVDIAPAGGVKRSFTVSGIYNDLGNLKAQGVPGVILSMSAAGPIPAGQNLYLIEFKEGTDIIRAEQGIRTALHISDERISRNERLLAVLGQSDHKAAVGLYRVGAILFLLVLTAGVVMIYNTFNISVMERMRQYGLLRCIGASPAQVRRIVRREGLIITLKAIPPGVLAGMVMTFACCAILKFCNSSLFGEIPLFSISATGIGAGILIGFLTVFTASLLPARKAARVSPVHAVTGGDKTKILKSRKEGLLTRILPVEIALGLNNALLKKKTLLLMACSIALSIVLFLGFNVFVDFIHVSLKTTKPYTPDITLTSAQGLDRDVYAKVSAIDGVKRVYGRMFGYVEAAFEATGWTAAYQESMGGVTAADNGLFVPPESSWLISYDENQLKWAQADLFDGQISEEKMDAQNGVIAVALHTRNGITMETAKLQPGDKVYFETPAGTKEFTVQGVVRTVPFNDSKLSLTAFITTEKIFTELTDQTTYDVLDIQLHRKNHKQAVDAITGLIDSSVSLLDSRQKNAEMNQTFLTMAVFIYGFVAVIALISLLNIFSTMNTSVASKTKYLGVMRAVGMSGTQLHKMVLVEAVIYALTGCLTGCVLGILLQRALIEHMLSSFHIIWKFPLVQIALILIITLFTTVFSVISPLKRIKAQGISEVIGSL